VPFYFKRKWLRNLVEEELSVELEAVAMAEAEEVAEVGEEGVELIRMKQPHGYPLPNSDAWLKRNILKDLRTSICSLFPSRNTKSSTIFFLQPNSRMK
jgi:hypothetical protein